MATPVQPSSDCSVAMNRLIGETTTQDPKASHDLLLHQPFVDQKSQLIGEVSPYEQHSSEGSAVDQEMVVNAFPEPASDEDANRGSHVTEESQSDNLTESQLLPNPGYGDDKSHDKLRIVSKEWVINEIHRSGEPQRREIANLNKTISEMDAKYKHQFELNKEELKIKQKDLEHCQTKLEDYKRKVECLQLRLEEEIESKEIVEQEKSVLEQKIKDKTGQVHALEEDVSRLTGQLRTAERVKFDSHTFSQQNESIKDIKTMISSQTDLLEKMHLHQTRKRNGSPSNDPISPTETETVDFKFLQGGQHYSSDCDKTMTFSPDSSMSDQDWSECINKLH